jgi:predicted amidophosphoribosyltransferase
MTDYDKARSEYNIKNICDYHPKTISRRGNPKHKGNSVLIIQLKNKDLNAIKCIAANIINKLPSVDVICTMPSSNAYDKRNGIRMLAEIIADKLAVENGTECLFRTTSRQKSCSGNRDINTHFPTLGVSNKDKLIGKKVLLLDDITTSGSSLQAGSLMLEKAGAGHVIKYALGATVWYGGGNGK